MSRYPTIEALAAADLEQVLRDWEGLGYYSRARNIHAAAREVFSRYGGVIPEDPANLKKLPGVGDYTAAAVASIAFGVRAAALDANNLRVLSRLLTCSEKMRITSVVSRIIPPNRPGDFNQALMDLGNSICTPKDPLCQVCPLSLWCRAYRKNRVEEYPEKKLRTDTIRVEAAIGIILDQDRVLVQKRPASGLLAGLWEFPGGKNQPKAQNPKTKEKEQKPESRVQRKNEGKGPGIKTTAGETSGMETPEEAVVREVCEETGLRIQVREKLGVFNHNYTQFRVKLHAFLCQCKSRAVNNPAARWVTLEELDRLPMPSVNRRIVRALEKHIREEK
jgi:A/G-specific adenine glycosylase